MGEPVDKEELWMSRAMDEMGLRLEADAEIARLRARIAELEVEVGSPDLEERVAIVNMLENMPKDDGFLSIPADEIIGAILARVEK